MFALLYGSPWAKVDERELVSYGAFPDRASALAKARRVMLDWLEELERDAVRDAEDDEDRAEVVADFARDKLEAMAAEFPPDADDRVSPSIVDPTDGMVWYLVDLDGPGPRQVF